MHIVLRLMFLACLAVALLPGPFARAQVLVLDQDMPVRALQDEMGYLLDDGTPLPQVVNRFREGGFSRDFRATARAGDPYQPVWAMVELTNAAPDDGRPGDDWLVASDIYGLVGLQALVFRESGLTEETLDYDVAAPFDASQFSVTRLRGRAFTLAPGESALLILRLTFGPVQSAALALETPDATRAAAFADGLELAGFYALMASALLFFFAFNAAMRHATGMAYAVLLALGLAFVAYLDLFLFRLLYPERPGWHLIVGLLLLQSITVLGLLTAALSLKQMSTDTRPVRPLALTAGIAALALPLSFVLPPEVMAPVTYVLFAAMLAAQVFATSRWNRIRGAGAGVFRALTLVVFLAVAAVLVVLTTRWGAAALPMGWAVKSIFTLVAVWNIGGLSISLIDIRRDHAAALGRELEALRQEARTAQELLEAERNYSRARDLATQRRRQLASMSHDIRQPLISLRMTMDAMARDQPPEVRARLSEAFDYMQSLSQDALEETRPDSEEAPAAAPDPERAEPYPLSLIFETVGQMFRQEAISKGIGLRIVPSSAAVTVPPMVLMRIVSNLVSNAVKYTDRGRVLLGARRHRGAVTIQVADTGKGMTGEEQAGFFTAYRSGPTSTGTGLGLAICAELAGAHGLDISVSSDPGRGTVFLLSVPMARAADVPVAETMIGSVP